MIIYALIDPRDGAIRYVGKTHRSARRRLQRHLAPSYLRGETHKERWIRVLLAIGLEPRIETMEACCSAGELAIAERRHIGRLRAAGANLTNATDGGDGGSGPHTAASKDRIRRALTGKAKSALHCARVALAARGRKATVETRAKLSADRKARGWYPPPRYGADNNKTKLTSEAVAEIRALRGLVSQRALAQRFGVSKTAVRYVQQGRNWREFPRAA